jgi:hypothetical protein
VIIFEMLAADECVGVGVGRSCHTGAFQRIFSPNSDEFSRFLVISAFSFQPIKDFSDPKFELTKF